MILELLLAIVMIALALKAFYGFMGWTENKLTPDEEP